jgi:hypothetical protein
MICEIVMIDYLDPQGFISHPFRKPIFVEYKRFKSGRKSIDFPKPWGCAKVNLR